MIDAHRSATSFLTQKSPLLRGEWPLQNPRVFTSRERSFGPPCLDAFHLWSMGGYKEGWWHLSRLGAYFGHGGAKGCPLAKPRGSW